MERNPNFRGPEPEPSTRSSSSSTATRTRSSGRCSSGEVDFVAEVQPTDSRGSAEQSDIPTAALAVARRSRELAFNLCSAQTARTRSQPGRPGPDRAAGDRLRDRPRAAQRDRDPAAPRSWPTGCCRVLQVVLRGAGAGLPVRRRSGEPDARRRGLGVGTTMASARRTARRSAFDLYVRSESPYTSRRRS